MPLVSQIGLGQSVSNTLREFQPTGVGCNFLPKGTNLQFLCRFVLTGVSPVRMV